MPTDKEADATFDERLARDDDAPAGRCAGGPGFNELVHRRYGRRGLLGGALAAGAVAMVGAGLLRSGGAQAGQGAAGQGAAGHGAAGQGAAADEPGRIAFEEVMRGVDETHHVAAGHRADILIRWGDPVDPGAPPFDPYNQTADAQERQFGYNNDFIGYVGLPFGSDSAERGLLCVNHEYTSEEVMFPGLGRQDGKAAFFGMTADLVAVEMAAHGASVIEVRRDDGRWRVVLDSPFNRRITARSTQMRITGPAAGHRRLTTGYDSTGTRVIGTLNNCAGGITPWGTYLMAEENFHAYFWGDRTGHPEEAKFARYGVPGNLFAWGLFHDRFNIAREPNEPNRFGWVVEVDPLDPRSIPKKRTALGRFKHEGAEVAVNGDGRVVVYSGDDQRFDYVYKFVSAGRYDPTDRAANMDLLDDGTLFVARFDAGGGVVWLPLVHGHGPLTAANGFASQADVLIDTRQAADLLGATPMDRPEDVEADPASGKVYVMLTNNSKRKPANLNPANDRPGNLWGQILEITPAGGDHAAAEARWELLVKCGDPRDPATGAAWNAATSANGWFACPDNCAVDRLGRLWIATDQGGNWNKASGGADGLWTLETAGPGRGTGRMFFRAPVGAEVCGPRFTADARTLFLAVQHPAVDGVRDYPGFARNSTFEDPATRWPDFDQKMPPRPAVVVITREDGGVVGS